MNGFVNWLMSPLSEWHLRSLSHKVAVGAVGAGVAWAVHRGKQPTWLVVLSAIGSAYAASMLLNAADRFKALPPMSMPQVPVQPTQPMPPMPPPKVEEPMNVPPPSVFDEDDKPGIDEDDGNDTGIFG